MNWLASNHPNPSHHTCMTGFHTSYPQLNIVLTQTPAAGYFNGLNFSQEMDGVEHLPGTCIRLVTIPSRRILQASCTKERCIL